MTKRSVLAIVVFMIAAGALTACGSRSGTGPEATSVIEAAATSQGSLIPVDLKNLPKEIQESDLIKEGSRYFINQYDLMDIARKEKKDIIIESADGYKITASADGNSLTKVPLKKNAEEQETAAKKDSGASFGTNNGGTPDTGGSVNTGGAANTGGSSSGSDRGEPSGGNSGGNTVPDQPAHTHNYKIYLGGTVATCTSPGTEIYACSCGATVTNTTPAVGHSFVPVYRTEDQGWNEDIYSDPVPVCNGCGQSLAGLSEDELMDHLSSCGPGSYTVKSLLIGQQWHANPVDVLDHYECSICGAWQ